MHTPVALSAQDTNARPANTPVLLQLEAINHKQGMTMAHVLQQGLWGEGILHSEHL